MLAGEAVRIAAIEALNPTQANIDGSGFPTIAEGRVFDSKAVSVNDLDSELNFTPVLSVYTKESTDDRRGEAASYSDFEPTTQLEIVGELAVIVQDEDGGEPYADALAANDPQARMVLAGLMARVKYILLYSEAGSLFRSVASPPTKVEMESHAVPEFGLRWQRIFLRMTFPTLNDDFVDIAGTPEPLATVMQALPEKSAGRAKLAALNAAFVGQTRTTLQEIVGYEGTDLSADGEIFQITTD